MEENVDVKALRARFNPPAQLSSRDSESPKSPRPALQVKPLSPIPDTTALSPHRLSPNLQAPARLPPFPSGLKPPLSPQAPSTTSHSGPPRTPVPPVENNKVKHTGELLQNMMLRHQRPPGPRLSPVLPTAHTPTSSPLFAAHAPVLPGPTAATPIRQQNGPPMGTPLRPQPKQRSDDDVAPLRRPLPPHAPTPPKPKRPAHVNLEPYRRFARPAPSGGVTTPTGPRTASVSPLSAGRHSAVPSAAAAPRLPLRDIKPGRLPRQATTVDLEDQEMYDDIGSLEKNDSWSDTGSLSKEEGLDELYEYIDEGQVEQIRAEAEKQKEERPEVKPSKKELKRQQEQERREAQERHRREEQLRKNFQLQGEVEVLHTASVRHDWCGGSKLDLSVRQGDRVDIIRLKNNPGGKWLARASGNYGYISNTCVDIDYDAIKRKATMIKRMECFDVADLPPPPPDPPGYNRRTSDPTFPDPPGYNQRTNGQDRASQEEDDYDDVDPNPGIGWSSMDFPPPPIELNIDPKTEKELRKKFKFEGPLKVLHTMMVDPNGIIKKPGAKDLSVAPGDILDVIQLNSKKALCRNKFGKYGYVSRSLLLAMEGDIYDDVEYPSDVYDNDNVDY